MNADRPAETGSGRGSGRRRFPRWLTKRIPAGGSGGQVRATLDRLGVTTVCQHARCPNQAECFSEGTATFMILGSVCTRGCRFCAVTGGTPDAVAADEPIRVAEAAAALGLEYVVVTSVTRDDLPDGGAGHFAATIRAIRNRTDALVEVLTPDFQGSASAIETVAAARPDVYNHNVETVPRLYAEVRPEADYRRSLDLLRQVAQLAEGDRTPAPRPFPTRGGGGKGMAGSRRPVAKSGLMVGLGETAGEVTAVMRDLREAGCRVLTIGQYLCPSDVHRPITRFVPPAEFEAWRREGLTMGFEAVASGPFVRSSWHARQVFEERESANES